jgi:hypothetical protein
MKSEGMLVLTDLNGERKSESLGAKETIFLSIPTASL